MTVKELINILEEYKDDVEVLIFNYKDMEFESIYDVDEVSEEDSPKAGIGIYWYESFSYTLTRNTTIFYNL